MGLHTFIGQYLFCCFNKATCIDNCNFTLWLFCIVSTFETIRLKLFHKKFRVDKVFRTPHRYYVYLIFIHIPKL